MYSLLQFTAYSHQYSNTIVWQRYSWEVKDFHIAVNNKHEINFVFDFN